MKTILFFRQFCKVSNLLLLAFLISIIACNKGENYLDSNDNNLKINSFKLKEDDQRVQKALNDFQGKEFQNVVMVEVQDIEGNPIVGATVNISEYEVNTNEFGIATIPNVTLNENFAYVTAKKDGYFEGSRAFIPNSIESGIGNQVKIKLFRMETSSEIDSNSKSVVNVQTSYGEGNLVFQGGFEYENGKPYNGIVNVYTTYIDPLNPDTANTMPGNLLGLNTNNEIDVLGTFGMVNVELRDDAGNELQISNPVEIRLPIAPEQLSDAPDEIPMWYFNATLGMWVEEGLGYKIGNEYSATVNHFTIWNYDIGIPYCTIYIDIEDQFGNPLNVTDDLIFFGTHHYGSAPSGFSAGWVPANTPLTYTASYTCGGTTYTGTLSIGPLSRYSHTNYTLVITTSIPSYTITGTLYDCMGAPISSPLGWVEINSGTGWIMVPTRPNGIYNYTSTFCSPPTFSIVGVQVRVGVTSTITLSPSPGTTFQNIYFCNPEYIEYSIDGGTIKRDDINPGGGFTSLSSFTIQAEDLFRNQTIITSQTTTMGFGYTYGSGFNQMEITSLSDPIWIGSSNHAIVFDLTNVSVIGRPIEVTFLGTFDDSTGTPHTISGKAFILRDF